MPTKYLDPQRKELSPGFLLLHAGSRWQRAIRKVLDPFDLTHGQFILLAYMYKLQKLKEPITQAMVSELSGYEEVTTSTMLATLLKKKYVVKKKHPSDQRAYAISLTASGRKLVVGAAAKVALFEKEFFAPVKGKKIFLEALKTVTLR